MNGHGDFGAEPGLVIERQRRHEMRLRIGLSSLPARRKALLFFAGQLQVIAAKADHAVADVAIQREQT